MINKALDITKYLVHRFTFDGDLVTNLKMQKILYFVYVWNLIKRGDHVFDEKFQAWPNGPVLYSVYKKLSKYKSSPIDISFTDLKSETDLSSLKERIGKDVLKIVDKVYEVYGTKSAFELVNLTHNGKPWKKARAGLSPTDPSSVEILDSDILVEYGKKQ